MRYAALGILTLFGLTLLTAVAHAAPIPDPGINLGNWFSSLVDAITAGSWKLVAAIGIVGLVAAARRWGTKVIPQLGSGKGAVALTLALGALGGLALALGGDQPATVKNVVNAMLGGLVTALTASGLYSQVKAVKKPAA